MSSQNGLEHLCRTTQPVPTPGKNEVLVEIQTVSLNYRDTEGKCCFLVQFARQTKLAIGAETYLLVGR